MANRYPFSPRGDNRGLLFGGNDSYNHYSQVGDQTSQGNTQNVELSMLSKDVQDWLLMTGWNDPNYRAVRLRSYRQVSKQIF